MKFYLIGALICGSRKRIFIISADLKYLISELFWKIVISYSYKTVGNLERKMFPNNERNSICMTKQRETRRELANEFWLSAKKDIHLTFTVVTTAVTDVR